MTITILGTGLASVAAALSLLAPTAPKIISPSDTVYCTDVQTEMAHPDCVEPPAPSIDYKGKPVAVEDKKKVGTFERTATINVLKNDAVQKRTKNVRIKLIGRPPADSGIAVQVKGGKIIYTATAAANNGGYLPYGGVMMRYQVTDFRGRSSNVTFVTLRVL